MSLTSYRAAPPRGGGCVVEGVQVGGAGFEGLATTYSPAS